MEIVVISRKTIKPCSPTPYHLRQYHLSFLDLLMFRRIQPWIFFYPMGLQHNVNEIKTLSQLKKSLAETLPSFYPLAGRLVNEKLIIECNDEGVPFLEAQSESQLAQFLQPPDIHRDELYQLLPCRLLGDELLAIQVTTFKCGGISIGISISHTIADGASVMSFVKFWASMTRGDDGNISSLSPQVIGSFTHFPPREIPFHTHNIILPNLEKVVAKRFAFSATSIFALKEKYAYNASFERVVQPTRVEALSTFLWSKYIEVTNQTNKTGTEGQYRVMHAVDLRKLMNPALPEPCFGNFSWVILIPLLGEIARFGYGLAQGMRDATRKINSNYVKKIQAGDLHIDGQEKEPSVFLNFTDLTKFKLYEVDFGWGKPIWVTLVPADYINFVSLFPSPFGGGIEVWICLIEDEMAKMEADQEFLNFVSQPLLCPTMTAYSRL